MAAARSFFQEPIAKQAENRVKDKEELLQELTTLLEAFVFQSLQLSRRVTKLRDSKNAEWGYYDSLSKADQNLDIAEAVEILHESVIECISSQQLEDRIRDMKFMENFQYSITLIRDTTRQMLALIANKDRFCFLAIAFTWMSLVIKNHILTIGPDRIQWFVERFVEQLAKHKIDGKTELWILAQCAKGWAQYVHEVAEIREKGKHEKELTKILECHLAKRLTTSTKFTDYHRANPGAQWIYFTAIQAEQNPVARQVVDTLQESVDRCQSPAISRIFLLYNDPVNFNLNMKTTLVTEFLSKLLRETKIFSFFLGYACDWLAKMMVLEVVTNGPEGMAEFSKIFRRTLMDAIVDGKQTLEDWVHTAGGWKIALDQGEPLEEAIFRQGRSKKCCGAGKRPKVTHKDQFSLCMYCGRIFCQKGFCLFMSADMAAFQEHVASVHGGWQQSERRVQDAINDCRDCSVDNKPLPDVRSRKSLSQTMAKCQTCNSFWCRMSRLCAYKTQEFRLIKYHIEHTHPGEKPFVDQCSICYTAKNKNGAMNAEVCNNCGRVYCTYNNCSTEFKNTRGVRYKVKTHYRGVHKMTIETPTNLD